MHWFLQTSVKGTLEWEAISPYFSLLNLWQYWYLFLDGTSTYWPFCLLNPDFSALNTSRFLWLGLFWSGSPEELLWCLLMCLSLLCLHVNHPVLLCFCRGNMKLLWQFMTSMWVGAFLSSLRSYKIMMWWWWCVLSSFCVTVKPIPVHDLCINIVYICYHSLLGKQLLSSSGENAPRIECYIVWVLQKQERRKSYSGTDFHSVHVSYSYLLKVN